MSFGARNALHSPINHYYWRQQVSVECKILSWAAVFPVSTEFDVFTEFCGIQYWPVNAVIRGQKRHILIGFRWLWKINYCMYTWFRHEIHDCHSGSDGRNIENIELSLSEILLVYLVDRQYLSILVAGDKYCIFCKVKSHGKLITICGKFAAVSRGICKLVGKICCGKLWSLPNCGS